MAEVSFTRHLPALFPSLREGPFHLQGTTVAALVAELELLAPGVGFYICDERGRLRRHVNIFVDDQLVVDRTALRDVVAPSSRVFIAQALSGG